MTGIIEETLVPGAVISEVARRHGLAPQQLFTWRRSLSRFRARQCRSRPRKPPSLGEQGEFG
jgi:transposase